MHVHSMDKHTGLRLRNLRDTQVQPMDVKVSVTEDNSKTILDYCELSEVSVSERAEQALPD